MASRQDIRKRYRNWVRVQVPLPDFAFFLEGNPWLDGISISVPHAMQLGQPLVFDNIL